MSLRWKSLLYFVLWFAISLVLLGGSAWGGAWIASCFRGGGPDRQDNVIAGLICGLALWLFVAVFHFGKESIVVSVAQENEFRVGIRNILTEMGYRIVSADAQHLRAKPGFHTILLGGGIEVELAGNNARISGPKLTLERVQTRLRYRNHLEKVHRRTHPPMRTEPERFVRHVEISATLDAASWDEFRAKVLQPLAAEGSVRLDVHLLIAPDDGVRDSVVESARRWLEKNADDAEVVKDFVQRYDPMLAETQPLP